MKVRLPVVAAILLVFLAATLPSAAIGQSPPLMPTPEPMPGPVPGPDDDTLFQ